MTNFELGPTATTSYILLDIEAEGIWKPNSSWFMPVPFTPDCTCGGGGCRNVAPLWNIFPRRLLFIQNWPASVINQCSTQITKFKQSLVINKIRPLSYLPSDRL